MAPKVEEKPSFLSTAGQTVDISIEEETVARKDPEDPGMKNEEQEIEGTFRPLRSKYFPLVVVVVGVIVLGVVIGVVTNNNKSSSEGESPDLGDSVAAATYDSCEPNPCSVGELCIPNTEGDGFLCQEDPCLDDPCNEGESCVLLDSSLGLGIFECRLDDPCDFEDSNPCAQGEECFASRDKTTFQCRIPGPCDADPNPCLPWGVCIEDGDGTHHCDS